MRKALANVSHLRDQWMHTFITNIHAYCFLAKYALPYLKSGDTIINTTSVTAYAGTGPALDHISTKGAIVHLLELSQINKLAKAFE